MKSNFVFMAFAKGSESTEGASIKRYIGVAPVYVIGVNPKKAELEKLYNTQLEKDPEYITKVEKDGESIDTCRIDFIVKTTETCAVEMTTKLSFFLRKEYQYNKDKSKVKIIDKYGRATWATVEEAKNKQIPMQKNGPATNIDADYHMAYIGEEELISFIKTYLNLPNVSAYVNGAWIPNDKVAPEDCEASFADINAFFKGNFKELADIIAMQPKNKVKVLFGVRTTDDNKTFQTFYAQKVLRNSQNDYSKLDAEIKNRKSLGGLANTEFECVDIHEYSVTPTDLSGGNPLGDAPANNPWEV